jgi:hypothetical protein
MLSRWKCEGHVRIVASLELMCLIKADSEGAADNIRCPASEAALEAAVLEHAVRCDGCASGGWWWRRRSIDVELVDTAAEFAGVAHAG